MTFGRNTDQSGTCGRRWRNRIGRPSRDTTIVDVTHRPGSTLVRLGSLGPPFNASSSIAGRAMSPESVPSPTRSGPTPPLMGFFVPNASPSCWTSTTTSVLIAGQRSPCSVDEEFGNQRGALPGMTSASFGMFGTRGSSTKWSWSGTNLGFSPWLNPCVHIPTSAR